jgi:uncharacterized protein YbjT (DUF2867 family)
MKAIVIGATGLIGSELVKQLLENEEFKTVVTLGRNKLEKEHPKLEQLIVNPGDKKAFAEYIRGDVLFCALGTTIKKAGSQEKFRLVDYTFVVNSAEVASQNGVKQFCVISSLGSNPASSNFYLRTKGEMEETIKKLNFESIHIIRPSLLLGERVENRPGEKIGGFFSRIFSFAFIGRLKRYKPVEASEVANTMIKVTLTKPNGVNIVESEMIGG